LTHQAAVASLSAQEHLAAGTFNRRYAALRSFARWCQQQGWLADDPLVGLERRPQPRSRPRALVPEQVEAALRGVRGLFWLIYDSGLRCQEALATNLEDVDWAERAIRIQGKGGRTREMFFSRPVSRYLDDYVQQRGEPTVGPLFITARQALVLVERVQDVDAFVGATRDEVAEQSDIQVGDVVVADATKAAIADVVLGERVPLVQIPLGAVG